jgi:hypothetical protein
LGNTPTMETKMETTKHQLCNRPINNKPNKHRIHHLCSNCQLEGGKEIMEVTQKKFICKEDQVELKEIVAEYFDEKHNPFDWEMHKRSLKYRLMQFPKCKTVYATTQE